MTDIGEATYAEAKQVVAQLDNAYILARRMQTETGGQLKIGLHTNLGSNWSGRILSDFLKVHPDIQIVLEAAGRPLSIRENQHDVIIHFGQTLDEDLPSRRLASLKRGYFASSKLVEQQGTPDNLAALANFRCIMTETQIFEGVWRSILPASGPFFEFCSNVRVNNIGLVHELILNGVGIGVLPFTICAADAAKGRMLQVIPEATLPELPIYATYLGKSKAKEKAKIFVNFLVKWFAENAAD